MKQKIILIVSILLFLAFLAWMISDLFKEDAGEQKNPYDYGMQTLRNLDSIPSYTEIPPFKPALEEITYIATDADGKIFIGGKRGVEILTSYGKTLNRFSIPGYATCITRLTDGNLAIGMEGHLEIWHPDGSRLAVWEGDDTASLITSVAATPDMIYTADAGNKFVYQHDMKGNLISKIGEKDPARNIPGFVIPSPFFDLAISPARDLWVVNPGRHQFEKYTHDGSLVTTWGEASLTVEGFTGCCNPAHFTFLDDGAFVTSEKGLERIKVYNADGSFRCLVAGAGSFDEGTKGLDLAAGLEGRILVLDPSRNQIRVFLPNEKN